MAEEKFTTRVIHGLTVKKLPNGWLCCPQCSMPLHGKSGCENCNPTKKAWRAARIQHYADTRHPQTLAQMVVELEDSYDVTPEFDIDEEWPNG